MVTVPAGDRGFEGYALAAGLTSNVHLKSSPLPGGGMAHDSELPDDVVRSLDLLVDSLAGLEVLVLLFRRQRGWTLSEVGAELGLPPEAARRELDRLNARGVIAVTDNGEPTYRYRPKQGAPSADVELIAEAYGARRIAIINHVASGALKRIRLLADAFRLKKGDTNE